ncbi:MAG: adenylyl-sulfate kinase [Reinekea sp.]|jgi:adenylylsulfate kinase
MITTNQNLVSSVMYVSPEMRAESLHQKPLCIWLTGLSGSGKSTIANHLDLALHQADAHSFILDGDNVRQGLNSDLSMSSKDRSENIRRVGEVSRLFYDSGLIVICAFISPYEADRQIVRSLYPRGGFVEVHLNASLEACEERDPKGLYQKAREGLIEGFTGIDSPYECPTHPEIQLDTVLLNRQQCVDAILEFIMPGKPI